MGTENEGRVRKCSSCERTIPWSTHPGVRRIEERTGHQCWCSPECQEKWWLDHPEEATGWIKVDAKNMNILATHMGTSLVIRKDKSISVEDLPPEERALMQIQLGLVTAEA